MNKIGYTHAHTCTHTLTYQHHNYPGMLTAWITLTLSHHLSLSAIVPADECKFLLDSQHWCKSVGVHWGSLLGVCTYFPSSTQYVSTVLLRWFVRWEVSGRITAASLFSSNQTFSPSILLKSMYCNHIVALTKNSHLILSQIIFH